MSLLDNKPLVKGVCPAGTNCVPQRRETLLAEVIYKKGLPQKSHSEFCGKRSSEHRSIAARNTAACEICSAATKRRETLLAEVIYKKGLPQKSRQRVLREPCILLPQSHHRHTPNDETAPSKCFFAVSPRPPLRGGVVVSPPGWGPKNIGLNGGGGGGKTPPRAAPLLIRFSLDSVSSSVSFCFALRFRRSGAFSFVPSHSPRL